MNEERRRIVEAECLAITLGLGAKKNAMLRGISAYVVDEILAKIKGTFKRKMK